MQIDQTSVPEMDEPNPPEVDNSDLAEQTERIRQAIDSFFDTSEEQSEDKLEPALTADQIIEKIDAHIGEHIHPSITTSLPIIDRRRSLITHCRTRDPELVINHLRSAVAIGRETVSEESVEIVIEQLAGDIQFLSDHFFRGGHKNRPPVTWNS